MLIPHNYTPRDYQIPFFNALHDGYKRGVSVWHRRAGKDKTAINVLAKEAKKRKGLYFYVFPTFTQAKKVIWNGMDRAGYKFMDHIPQEIRRRTNESEMLVELDNGSIIQIVGSDKYDALMGTNPLGLVFSEYSLQDPRAWQYIQPILVENQGWAYFIYTPRGHSHGYDLYKRALASDHWFCEVLTINDTKVVTQADVTLAIAGGMSEDMVEQEFYCSFEASMPGAVYGKQIQAATKEGRITGVPHQEGFEVHTYWDLGYRDSTAIWFVQDAGREVHLIDYYENALQPLSHYLDVLKNYHNDKGYMYGNHYAPHDIKVHTIGSFGMSTWEQAKEKGLTFQVMPKLKREAGIEASRALFSSCWFDAIKCEHGIDALKTYRYEYKIDTKAYHLEPVHDWASDGADAFRTLGVCHQFEEKKEEMKDIDYGDPDGYAGYYKGGL